MNLLSSASLKYLGHPFLNSGKFSHIVGYNLPTDAEGIYLYSQTAFMLQRKTNRGRKTNPNQNWHTTCRIKIKDDLFSFHTNRADLKRKDYGFQDEKDKFF